MVVTTKLSNMTNNETITNALRGICNFYIEKFSKMIPKKWIKALDMTNPYSINNFLMDLDEKDKFNGNVDIVNFIDDIFKYIGYENIAVAYSKREELDWENEWVTHRSYCSYFTDNNGGSAPLAFVNIFGNNVEPIEIISFILNTIAAYDMQKFIDESWEQFKTK